MRALLLVPFLLAVATADDLDPAGLYGIWRVDVEGAVKSSRIHIGPEEWAVGSPERGFKTHAAKWLDGGRVELEGETEPYALRLEEGRLYLAHAGTEVPLAPVRRLRDFHGAWRFDAAALDWDRVLADAPEVIHETIRESTMKYARSPRSRFVFTADTLVLRRGNEKPAARAIVSWQLVDEATARVSLGRSVMELRLEGESLHVFYPKSKVRWALARAAETHEAPDVFGTWRFDKSRIDWDRALAEVAEEDRDRVRANLEGAEDGATTLVLAKDRIVWGAGEGQEYPVSAWEQVGPAQLRAGFGAAGEYVDVIVADGMLYLRSASEGAALPFTRVPAPEAVQAAAADEAAASK